MTGLFPLLLRGVVGCDVISVFLEFDIVVSCLYSILIESTTMAHVSATNHEPMFYRLSVKSNCKKSIQLS